ncbi:hypothetical protein TNCV_1097611 [Trichonephila clavipes]|nr:hypothetical protein TNCV_1097611 [Trichonephila clavipes]
MNTGHKGDLIKETPSMIDGSEREQRVMINENVERGEREKDKPLFSSELKDSATRTLNGKGIICNHLLLHLAVSKGLSSPRKGDERA